MSSKSVPHGRGTVREVAKRGDVVGYRALLPRDISVPPKATKNARRYQQPIGHVFSTAEEARARLDEEIARLRRGGTSRNSKLPPDGPGVYVVRGAGGFLKIGKSVNVRKRLRGLQTTHPARLCFLGLLSADTADEALFLDRFAEFKTNGEWFRPGRPILDAIKGAR